MFSDKSFGLSQSLIEAAKGIMTEAKVSVGGHVMVNQPGTSMHGEVGKVVWSNDAGTHHEIELHYDNKDKQKHSFSTKELRNISSVNAKKLGLTESVLSEALKDYKHKEVKGLYNYSHFEHPNGSFIQLKQGKEFIAVHQDHKGNRKEFHNMDSLKKHISSLNESSSEETKGDLKDPKKLKGGKTKVDVEPETDDTPEDMDSEVRKKVCKEEVLDESDLKKISTDKLQAVWNRHKDEERPVPTLAAKLKKINAELASRKKSFKEEILDEARHKVAVTVSEPNHTMVSQRNNKTQKFVNITAADKDNAEQKAKDFYKKKGYKVHSSEYHSKLDEEILDEAYTIKSAGYGKVHVVKGGKILKTFSDPESARIHIAKLTKTNEEEEITEISKKLAKSYLDGHKKESEENGGQYSSPEKFYGRGRGASIADAKLKGRVEKKNDTIRHRAERIKIPATNEEEEITELSKGTLGSYVKKAAPETFGHAYAAGHASGTNSDSKSKSMKKSINRMQGIVKAATRLTKEEIERIEAIAEKLD